MKHPDHHLLKTVSYRAYRAHAETNHFYNGNLPYSFHLKLAENVGDEFDYLLSEDRKTYPTKFKLEETEPLTGQTIFREYTYDLTYLEIVKMAISWHDSIEDARYTYNDVVKEIGTMAADIVFAVTNLRGKNRDERAGNEYYAGIVDTRGALYVKLCDRIANLRFGILTGSNMVKMYRKEYSHFLDQVCPGMLTTEHELADMFKCLKDLLKEK